MIIKNGLIVINNELVKKDILIENGLIKQIDDFILGAEIIDASNCLVMPGATDVHVHLREPGYEYKETIKTGTLAAAKGGVTTVLSMPNLRPCPHNKENLQVQLDAIKKDAVVHVYPFGAVTVNEAGQELAEIEQIKDLVVAFSDDGVGVNNIDLLLRVMELAKKYDFVIASHAEDLVNGKLPEGEYKAVRREIELAKKIGCKYHFCHMSTKESFDAIREAHQQGYTNITCEVSPHHLLLNEEMIKDGNYKMNPPLRDEANRLATIEALLDGTAIMIASDHAPHALHEKNVEYSKCLNGIIGIETMLPLIYTHFVDKGLITYEDFIALFVTNPNKVFNLKERKIDVGYEADITILDIETSRVYTKEEIVSKSCNAPYIGMTMKGFPKYTLVNGEIVWRDIKDE